MEVWNQRRSDSVVNWRTAIGRARARERERDMYVLQEMTSHVALSPLTLFCDVDTIYYSSKFPPLHPPQPYCMKFSHVIKIFVLRVIKKGQMEF